MTFGEALERMKDGAFVSREGWNGKDAFIYIVEGSEQDYTKLRGRAQKAAAYAYRLAGLSEENLRTIPTPIKPHIDMFTQKKEIVCGWVASQEDLEANDWYVREYAQNC